MTAHLTASSEMEDPLRDLRTLVECRGKLHKDCPIMAAARKGVDVAIDQWLVEHVGKGEDPDFAHRTIGSLPQSRVDSIVETRGRNSEHESIWYRHIASWAPQAPALHRDFFLRSDGAIDRLLDLGLDLDSLLSPAMAARVWLVRGKRYGSKAFRREWPRKSPVIVYWEQSSLTIPDGGLCPDGVQLMAEEIRSRSRLPSSIMTGSRTMGMRCNWQITLALMIQSIELPHWVKELHLRGRIFGRARTEQVNALFGPTESAHAALAQKEARSRLPSLEEILALPKYADPAFLDPYLPKV